MEQLFERSEFCSISFCFWGKFLYLVPLNDETVIRHSEDINLKINYKNLKISTNNI